MKGEKETSETGAFSLVQTAEHGKNERNIDFIFA